MRATAESTFLDHCELGAMPAHVWGSADTNNGAPVFGNAIACGFQPMPAGEVSDGSQVPMYDAVLRLPYNTDVTNLDRVKITHRHGAALATPEYFTVYGHPALGPSALVLKLKHYTGPTTR
jgi:hypothetical protein